MIRLSRSLRARPLTVLWAIVGASMLVISAAPAEAATNELAFGPQSSSVGVGHSVNVEITIANVTNLGGYNLNLQFNPAIVHLSSLVDSGFVTNNPNNIVVCNSATINNTTGTATDSCATQAVFGPPGPGVSTTTAMALMNAAFTGVTTGASQLTLNGTTLLDPNGNLLSPAPTLGTGNVTVTLSVGGVAQLPDPGAPGASNRTASRSYVSRELVLVTLVAVPALIALAWRRRHR